jgi:hypothetical protein
MNNNDIGHWIMVRRAMLRMSQARLAKAIGVDQSYISLIERNERPLTDELLQKVAAALGCKPEDLQRWPQAA